MSEMEQYHSRTEMTPSTSAGSLATTQDVAVVRLAEWARSAEAAHHIATILVQTSFCPEAFRNKPGEATAAILAGMEVGLQPMAALRSFDIIAGTAAPRAITLRAVVQGAGHEMVLVESTAERCRMKGRRRGASEWSTVTWTMDRARALGVTNKPNWKNQPQAMLVARSTSELARLVASDAILGIGYSAEEVADGGPLEQQTASETTTASVPAGTRRMGRNLKPVLEQAEPASDPDDPPPDTITSAQQKKMGALMREAGLTDRPAALAYVAEVIGREVASRNDLDKAEASAVIDALLQQVAPSADPADPADPWAQTDPS